MINIRLVFLTLISTLLIGLNYGFRANFDIYAKSMKYWYDKEYGHIPNPKACKIKTSKKYPGGTVSCEGYLLKRIDYVYAQIQLFYRYGTIYRNYLINYAQLEPCKLVSVPRHPDYLNPLADLILMGLKNCCPHISHPCPYYPGWYNASNIDINGTVAPYLPPVVPVGQYKVYGRAFLVGNKTIGEAEGVGVVKANFANRITDFSMLNMG